MSEGSRRPDLRLFPRWLYRAFYALHAAAYLIGLVSILVGDWGK